MIEKTFTVERANHFIDKNQSMVIDTYKPDVHFTAPVGWINDPNGFVYFRGEYHLFYQYYPYDSVWGPMHWGHAKTKNFIDWENLPVALAPDMPYDKDGCFSGSAFVKDDTLWIMYTGNIIDEVNGNKQVQNIAFSKDGVNFEKIATNPVATGDILPDTIVKSDFRDPKLFEKDGRFYAVVAAQHKDNVGCIVLLGSENLIEWSFESILLKGNHSQGVMWECPDYFEMNGNSYLILSPMKYPKDGLHFSNLNSSIIMKGTVDWAQKQFHVTSVQELDQGHDFYAPQTLIDDKGRRVMIAWMHTWGRRVVTHDFKHHWSGQMTMPRILCDEKGIVKQKLSEEIMENLPTLSLNNVVKNAGVLSLEGDKSYHFILGNDNDYISFGYDDLKELVYIDRSQQAIIITGEEDWDTNIKAAEIKASKLDIIIDKNTIEIFVNDGEATLSSTYFIQKQPILQEKV